ncbi:hypothetical protein AGMMS49950_04230 [Endomicrobiia bacterium]|nr:hypothetical protein AGMMS49950_04230 [Endomicrobiia bacterium]
MSSNEFGAFVYSHYELGTFYYSPPRPQPQVQDSENDEKEDNDKDNIQQAPPQVSSASQMLGCTASSKSNNKKCSK